MAAKIGGPVRPILAVGQFFRYRDATLVLVNYSVLHFVLELNGTSYIVMVTMYIRRFTPSLMGRTNPE